MSDLFDIFYVGLDTWPLDEFCEFYAEDFDAAYDAFCQDVLDYDYCPEEDGNIVVYKHCLPRNK